MRVSVPGDANKIFGDGNVGSAGNGTKPKAGSGNGHIIFRPFQTYRMASAILAKGGSDLGATYHGHHDFMLSDDILRKVHVGHYTFYSKSIIKRPKNYIIIEDVFSQGYIGGEGTRFFSKDELEEGLSEGTLGKGGGPSLICVKSDGGEPDSDVLDITGRFQQSVYDIYNEEDSQVEHYKGSGSAYEEMKLQMLEPYRNNVNDEYIQRVQRFNTVCFRGMQYTAKAPAGKMELTQLNTGHWGTNIYAGVRKVREGENSFMKQCEHDVVSVV